MLSSYIFKINYIYDWACKMNHARALNRLLFSMLLKHNLAVNCLYTDTAKCSTLTQNLMSTLQKWDTTYRINQSKA